MGAGGAGYYRQRHADLPECHGRRRDCGRGRGCGKTGDARNRCALHARGDLIGVGVLFFSLQHAILPAYALLLLIGVLGGFFVVPLNALLQERGKQTVGAGNAIAVQNLGENMAMLLMLGIYSLAVKAGAPVVAIGVGFGALFALAITGLWVWQRRR